jgi:uncharacterized membrane protein
VDKKPLIVVSICAVVLLVLGSLSNVVGYQSVQTSQQNIIKERINQRELLFQTIVDIANNKEIQRIILKSQMMNGKFFSPDAKLQTSITKQQLRQMYLIGVILSKIISKSRMQSMVQQYQSLNHNTQERINAVIEKDSMLTGEMDQLSNSECDCENQKTIRLDLSTTICNILLVILIPFLIILETSAELVILFEQNPILRRIIDLFSIPAGLVAMIIFLIGLFLNCWY